MTILPLVNAFTTPYEHWERRKATQDEMMAELKKTGKLSSEVKVRVLRTITNAVEAAVHVAEVAPDDQRLANQIDDSLKGSPDLKEWMKAMPSSTPKGISVYQKNYSTHDPTTVNEEIKSIGATLSPGQYLFHGGCWSDKSKSEIITDAPLSTTLCPQVAFMETLHGGKAYHEGRIDLFVLRVASSETNVYAFKHRGLQLGHEKEVLFAAGAKLTLRNDTLIDRDLIAHAYINYSSKSKPIQVHVLEVDIS